MLPEFLATSYMQYKADTNHVVTWLATTAKACGFSCNLGESKREEQPKPKLRGRARKLARDAAKANNSADESKKNNALPTYTISVKDLQATAKHIANAQSRQVEIPRSFILAINRAIALRKRVAIALSNETFATRSPADHRSDGQHLYFIGILEGIRKTLNIHDTTGISRKDGQDQAVAGSQKPRTTSANPFDLLELDGQEQSSDDDAPIARNTSKIPSDHRSADYQVTGDNFIGEAFVALDCFIQDLKAIRGELYDTWMLYGRSKIELLAVSLMSDIGCELVRHLEEEIKPCMKMHGGFENVFEKYHAAKCAHLGFEPDHRVQFDDDLNFQVYDAASFYYWPTYLILRGQLSNPQPTGPSTLNQPQAPIYDPLENRSIMTPRQQYMEDKAMVYEVIRDLQIFLKSKPAVQKLLRKDEFLRGLEETLSSKSISLSLVFTAQIFLDIQHILREESVFAMLRLTAIAQEIRRSVSDHRNDDESKSVGVWTKSIDGALYEVDCAAYNSYAQIMRVVRDGDESCKAVQRLKISCPTICGLGVYCLKTQFVNHGIEFANSPQTILCVAHLYNALKMEKVLGPWWADMEYLLDMQDRQHLFAGDPPSTRDQYDKRFLIMLGISISNFAANRRLPGSVASSKAYRRKLDRGAVVTHMFQSRFQGDSRSMNWTVQDVEKVLDSSNWDGVMDAHTHTQYYFWRGKAEQATHLKEKWKKKKKLTASSLLQTLATTLQVETGFMSIDWFLVHRQCWKLLRAVELVIGPQFRQMIGPDWDTSFLPHKIGFFLTFLADEEILQQNGLKRLGSVKQIGADDMLVRVAECVIEFLGQTEANEEKPNSWKVVKRMEILSEMRYDVSVKILR